MSILRTSIIINSGSEDYDVPIEVEYRHYKGCPPTLEHPGDHPETSILSITVISANGKRHSAEWLQELMEYDDELIELIQQDWEEDQDAAAEYRAEMRRDAMEDRS